MSKAHRGKGIRELPSHGRGSCPVCKRDNVKILYEQEIAGVKQKMCSFLTPIPIWCWGFFLMHRSLFMH